MRTSILGCFAILLASPLLSYSATENGAKPASQDAAGLKAWEMLGAFYHEAKGDAGLDKATSEALKSLAGSDPRAATNSADLLWALFRQAAADESNGRAEWRRTPYWGGGSESAARDFRAHLAGQLAKIQAGPAAIPLAESLLANENHAASLSAATHLLETAGGTAGDAAILRLLDQGCHWRPALIMALREVDRRSLNPGSDSVRKWSADPRAPVRKAAEKTLGALGAGEPATFQPEDGFSPPVVKLLKDAAAMLPDPPASDAKFGLFTTTSDAGSQHQSTSEVTGWLRGEKDGNFEVTSWFGISTTLENKPAANRIVSFTPLDPASVVDEILKSREVDDEQGRERRLNLLSERGGLTGQFQPSGLSVPEGLLASWLFQRGDTRNAARLLFPLLDKLDDDRRPLEILRDLIGGKCHVTMLEKFSLQRNYSEALRLARHLSQPLFDGYEYQERAKELAAQLPMRMEDFKTHALPAEADWKTIAAGLKRAGQVDYLAARLRLLNCFQDGQPGDVNFTDPQYSKPGRHWPGESNAESLLVINPFNELRKLRLTPSDIPALAPFLKDDSFLPTFCYWRDFHPSRTLHRVSWLAVKLVNAAAMHELVGGSGWQKLDPPARDERVAGVIQWANDMAGKPLAEIIRSNMNAAKNEQEWFTAAREAATRREISLMPDLLSGAKKFPESTPRIAVLCFQNGSEGALPVAKKWISLPDTTAKLYSALMLVRHGSASEKETGLKVLDGVLRGDWEDNTALSAVEAMLSLENSAVTALVCSMLKHRTLDWNWSGGQLAHRLFLSRHPAALPAIVEALSSSERPRAEEGDWKGKQVMRKRTKGDRVAEALNCMRKDHPFPSFAPDQERKMARVELAAWLAAQAALLKEAKPTPELETRLPRMSGSEWQVDAP